MAPIKWQKIQFSVTRLLVKSNLWSLNLWDERIIGSYKHISFVSVGQLFLWCNIIVLLNLNWWPRSGGV